MPHHPPPADDVKAGATWIFQVAAEPVGKADHIVRTGGRPCNSCGQPKGHPRLALKKKSAAFERQVGRVAAGTLPPLGKAAISLDVQCYKPRPKTLITSTQPRGPIPCPVKPDGTNVFKSVEDSLMRCRVCTGSKRTCREVGHVYSPTLIDDATVVDGRCRTYYTAIIDVAAKLAQPARIVVTVTVIDARTKADKPGRPPQRKLF